jgi:hypothetical protein
MPSKKDMLHARWASKLFWDPQDSVFFRVNFSIPCLECEELEYMREALWTIARSVRSGCMFKTLKWKPCPNHCGAADEVGQLCLLPIQGCALRPDDMPKDQYGEYRVRLIEKV